MRSNRRPGFGYRGAGRLARLPLLQSDRVPQRLQTRQRG